MSPRKKRKPDFRPIHPSQTYSISEFAEANGRDGATIRRWLREGMPTLDGLKPTVIDGAQAREWLRLKWALRKTRSGRDEAHCFRCRKSRPFANNSRSMKQISGKVLSISGQCAVCGTGMNKFAGAASVSILGSGNERKAA